MPVSKHMYSNRRRSVIGDLNKDGKLSSYEKKRDNAIKKAMGKKKAYGGAVKKYAMGGGVRKAMYK